MKALDKKHKSIKICILISFLCLILSGLLFIVTGILYDSPYNIGEKEIRVPDPTRETAIKLAEGYGWYDTANELRKKPIEYVDKTVEYHKKDFEELPTGIAAIILVLFGIPFLVISLIRLIVYKIKNKAPKQQIIINNYYYKQ